MKQLFFFTSRLFSDEALLAGLLGGMALAGLLLYFAPSPAFAQSENESGQNWQPGLQIYVDEQGNRVMRTIPAPRDNYQDNSGDIFYISPRIYPKYPFGNHNGHSLHPGAWHHPFPDGGDQNPLHPEIGLNHP